MLRGLLDKQLESITRDLSLQIIHRVKQNKENIERKIASLQAKLQHKYSLSDEYQLSLLQVQDQSYVDILAQVLDVIDDYTTERDINEHAPTQRYAKPLLKVIQDGS